jgi:beta-phosphoglucomutase
MKISCIVFDLDGVLVDTEDIHFKSLGFSVLPYMLPDDIDRLFKKDGTSTRDKLTKAKEIYPDLPIELIDADKQKRTLKALAELKPNWGQIHMFQELRKKYLVALVSNSRRVNVDTILDALEIGQYFDFVLCSDDHPELRHKPAPDLYNFVFNRWHMSPQVAMILEDSPAGIEAATASGAHVLKIETPRDTTLENIQNGIQSIETNYHSTDGRGRQQILRAGLQRD